MPASVFATSPSIVFSQWNPFFNSPLINQPTRLNIRYKKRYSLPYSHHPRTFNPIFSLPILNTSLIMASKITSLLLARVFLCILLAIAGQAVATRDIPRNPQNDDQMKQPEWLIEHDRSVLIPGLGRVMLPPFLKPQQPYSGSIGGSIAGTRYIPGGDDTFVPNPGFEVPIPGNGDGGAGTYPHP